MRGRALRIAGAAAATLLGATRAQAAPGAGGVPADAAAGAADASIAEAGAGGDAGASRQDGGSVEASCIERVPAGKDRPGLFDSAPPRAVSGHAMTLTVFVDHGAGETVLPSGFRVQLGAREARVLERAGFHVPDPDGGAGPLVSVEKSGERARTRVLLQLVPLPPRPGRNELVLPPLPIAVARSSGEIVTLCTEPHPVIVEDPIANVPDARPRHNPPARRQLEEWSAAKQVSYGAAVALAVGALGAWLIGMWLRRPKPAPPPPPPRPPWEVALEELFDIKNARLVEQERLDEHFDRVSSSVRKYLGARYGFDGLESTTREILDALGRHTPRVPVLAEVEVFLREADLVKFARMTPEASVCEAALLRGEDIVRRTIPVATTIGSPPAASRPAQEAGP